MYICISYTHNILKTLELYTHNIVLWKRKLKMAADTAQFVGIFCSEKENINLKILIGDIAPNVINIKKKKKINKKSKKSNYDYSNTLNILHIQRKCLSMDVADRHFGETLRYLKIRIFLFLNQEIDI